MHFFIYLPRLYSSAGKFLAEKPSPCLWVQFEEWTPRSPVRHWSYSIMIIIIIVLLSPYCLFILQLMKIPDNPQEQHPFKKLTAGALAGIVSVTATYPMDLVR